MELIPQDDGISVPSSGDVQASLRYYVADLNTDPTLEDVVGFLETELPRTFGQLRLTGFDPRRIGKGLYSVDATYALLTQRFAGVPALDPSGAGSYTFSFSTTGATYHTKFAKDQDAFNGTYGTADATVGHKINWNGQSADGIDIVGPQLQITIRKRLPGSRITLPFIRQIVSLTGKTNNATFMQFAAGELLFMGAEGQMVVGQDTEVTYNFSAAPNVASADIDGVTVTDIKGHEYIWAFMLPGSNNSADIRGMYKARLYDSADFTLLGI
jgi:hypothetical protein